MAQKDKILVVDDEPSIRKYLQTLLEVDGFDVETVSNGKDALECVGKNERPEFIILDVLMPEMDGLETLRQLMQVDRGLNVIMLSCSNEVTTVVEAIRLGALDYLTKPFEKPELDAAFLKCRQKQQLRSENQALREYCEALTEDISFLAASPQMLKIRQQILQIAPVDVPVFISGESGVGKEVVARMIHLRSTRRQQAFVKVNCAALPGELLESELFGYDQGAFTGAVRSKPGKFELANKGTIFLDEIAEMSPHLQAKLLHVLQDGQFSRLRRARRRERGCARAGRDEHGSERSDAIGPLSRRPLLPSERALDPYPASPRAHHGNSAAFPALSGEIQREISKDCPGSLQALDGGGASLLLAGESARTGKLCEAVRHSGR